MSLEPKNKKGTQTTHAHLKSSRVCACISLSHYIILLAPCLTRPVGRWHAIRHTLTTDGICLSYVLADCAQPVAAWRGSAGSEKARGGVLLIVVAFCDALCPRGASARRLPRDSVQGPSGPVPVPWGVGRGAGRLAPSLT